MIVYASNYGRYYTENEIKYEVELWVEHSKICNKLNQDEQRILVNDIIDILYSNIDGETVYSWLQSLTTRDVKHLINKIVNQKIKNVV